MIETARKNSDLHLWGLLSDGGVLQSASHTWYGLLGDGKKHGLTTYMYMHFRRS